MWVPYEYVRINAILVLSSLGCWHVSFLAVVKGFFLVWMSSFMSRAVVVVVVLAAREGVYEKEVR